ncbi:MAG: peptidyl-prolyl cis-trans isomerase [Sandaracinaceae bacterium]
MNLRALAREPLVHFALLGAGVFLLHASLERPPPGPPPIVLDQAFVDGLGARDPAEREARVEAWIRDEVLVREARARGLDRGDPIVRRRLVQKMELLLEATADVEPPRAEDLAARLADDARYHLPGQTVFEHVFFRRAREHPVADARAALRSDPPMAGDAFLLGARIGPRTDAAIRSSFGENFADALAEAPIGVWAGPLESAYGAHLVRVASREPTRVPPLASVEGRVRADLEREARAEAVRRMIESRIAATQVQRPAN